MRVKQGNLIYVGRVRECLNMEAILKLRTLEWTGINHGKTAVSVRLCVCTWVSWGYKRRAFLLRASERILFACFRKKKDQCKEKLQIKHKHVQKYYSPLTKQTKMWHNFESLMEYNRRCSIWSLCCLSSIGERWTEVLWMMWGGQVEMAYRNNSLQII